MSLDLTLYPTIPAVASDAPRPFWSVIVPAYKAKHLAEALRSVVGQAPPREQMEILVVDDHSPEALEPIVRQVGGDRIAYIRQPENRGTYPTENAGVAMSRGRWIHILNDDDWVRPGFYAVLQASLECQPETVGAGFCRCTQHDVDGTEVSTPSLGEPRGVIENFIDQIGVGNKVHPVSVVFRRACFERLGGFYPNLSYCADWEFNKRVATFFDWWYEPQPLACYRVNPNSMSTQTARTGQHLRDLAHAIELSQRYLPVDRRDRLTAASRDQYAIFGLTVAVKALNRGDLPGALMRIQGGLALSRSPQVLERLVQLLAMPSAAPLRQSLPAFFERLKVPRRDAGSQEP